jgi:hypothetical protein
MAFIFEDLGTNAWARTAVLTPSVAGDGSFGMHVSVTSTTALVSHPLYPTAYGSGLSFTPQLLYLNTSRLPGALVSFSKIGGQWSQQQYLVGHDASFNQYFIGGTNYYRYANLGWYGLAYSHNTAISNLNNYGTTLIFSIPHSLCHQTPPMSSVAHRKDLPGLRCRSCSPVMRSFPTVP